MVTDRADSPHRMAPQIRCESYFALRRDRQVGAAGRHRALQAALEAAGTPHRLEWYPGAEHGFVFPLRAGIYDQPAAERHWERLFALFRRPSVDLEPPANQSAKDVSERRCGESTRSDQVLDVLEGARHDAAARTSASTSRPKRSRISRISQLLAALAAAPPDGPPGGPAR